MKSVCTTVSQTKSGVKVGKRRASAFLRRRLVLLIRFVVGLTLLVAVFSFIDVGVLASTLTSIHLVPAIALFVTGFADRMLMAYKWNLLLDARGIRISFCEAARLYYVGQLVGTFTPGAIGADVYRVTALSRFHKNQVVVSTVLIERLIGLIVLVLWVVITLPVWAKSLGADSEVFMYTITVTAILAAGATVLSLCPSILQGLTQRIPKLSLTRIGRSLQDFYTIYAESRLHVRTLLIFAMLTALELVVLIYFNYLAARSLRIDLPFVYFLCVMPLILLLIRLPISFSGIGLQEGLLAYFFLMMGFSAEDGVSISILLRAVELILVFIPATMLLWVTPILFHPANRSSQTDAIAPRGDGHPAQ